MSASQQTTLSYYPPGVSLGPQASPSPSSQQFPVNLGSNNPFRTRTLSPSNSIPSGGRPERPKSTNPFLDDTDPISPQSAPSASLPDQQPDMTQNTRDLFENLSLNAAPKANGMRPAPPRPEKRPQNAPLKSRPPRPSRERSQGRSDDPFNIFADPPDRPPKPKGSGSRSRDRERRPRRNSESSVMERTPKLLDDDDERRRRERRRREREGRHKDGKSRSSRKGYQLDIIDKLDVTSIYGTGMFHHDGPFDACNPHRNRKGQRAAPLQAFPKDSSNMALGGAGPNNEKMDLDRFHGRMQEGYNDFASTGVADNSKTEGVSFDPTSRIEPIHGDPSMGLGTSTFLDGAPASRAAIRENQTDPTNGAGGLQRKKSLAQRIRGGINRPPPRVLSPQSYGSPATPNSPRNERNPFFQDYDDAWDKKGARINSADESRGVPEGGRVRSSSSPKQATSSLERRLTDERTEAKAEEPKNTGGGGFINRMKSLRKPQPPRRRVTDE